MNNQTEHNNGRGTFANNPHPSAASVTPPTGANDGISHGIRLIDLEEPLSLLTKSQREKLISGYDVKSLAKVFEDEGLMQTISAFFSNDLNISLTARRLYMHRNTLIYKLNAIKKATGFDLRDFSQAVTFKILHILYVLK